MQDILGNKKSLAGKKWLLKQFNDRSVLKLSEEIQVSEIVARLLTTRDIDQYNAADFLRPTVRSLLVNPWQLLDLEVGINRLIQAIQNREKIAIFGDYDVDGATSTALMIRFLRAYNVDVIFYIPDRITEGYGPNLNAFKVLKNKGVELIITVDCGTTSYEVLSQAHDLGIAVVVIDHHIGELRQPQAVAIINPNRFDQPDNPYKICAAVGICFIVIACLRSRLRAINIIPFDNEFDPINLLDLVAVGTVCDVVPLKGINRAFVTQGLKILTYRRNIGLNALSSVAQINQVPTTYHLGFVIGPRINAGGRVGQSDLGVKLLISDCSTETLNLAEQLSAYNVERQSIEQVALQQALNEGKAQENDPVIIVASSNWHLGIIGILAGRLKDRYNRPTFVINFEGEIGKGSARSVSGLDIGSIIQAAKQLGLLINGGGHAMAGGITIHHSQLANFKNYLTEKIKGIALDLIPHVYVDSYLKLSAATISFVDSLNILEPYGQSNPRPYFVFENLFVTHCNIVGQDHLRVTLKSYDGSTITAMAFRCLDTPLGHYLQQPGARSISILGSLKLDEWLGRKKITLMIEDIAV